MLAIREKGFLLVLFCSLYACAPDTVKELPSTPVTIEEPMELDSSTVSCMALHYQYTNHKKFLNWTNGADSLRRAYGLENQTILRIIDDTTRVLELLTINDILRGHEFANSDALKTMADTSGFIGTPTVYLLNAVHMEKKKVGATCMLLQHDVRDFKEWRSGFEEYSAQNDDENLKALCIFNTYQDPRKVSVLMEIQNLEMAKELVSSPETIAMMRAMGATTDPKMTLLEVWR
ncbi:MAG: hypothetical protein JKX73_08580 [Flavobacteriales bacterium]|nr:hypothetical protein [Flavobacteriales bacterium]